MAILDFFKNREKEELSVQTAEAEEVSVSNLQITSESIHRANEILNRYKEGKANLESRIVENDRWWRLRHWNTMRKAKDDIAPASAWLFNSLASKHADAMDNYPEIVCLPREANDSAEADSLTDILPVILEQNNFEQTYSDLWWYKLKTGCGVYGIFWDSNKLNGLGDISINQVDLLNLFWEPGITDIQKSPNLFYVSLEDNEVLLRKYPRLENSLTSPTFNVKKYVYDDTVDTSTKSAVIDWYYKRGNVLHFVKYVNDIVLYATENETEPTTDEEGNVIAPAIAETGLYDHGKYPFVFDVLFREEGTPSGFGFVDICKEPQKYIDYMNDAFLTNILMQSRPRYFFRNNGKINEEEFLDWRKSLVHVQAGGLSDDLSPIQTPSLSSAAINILQSKIDELKETSGNRDVSNGGTSGATAASAIAAMQEAGSKLSRDMIKTSYRAFKEVNLICIELIRQFYTVPRSFRITGKNNEMAFVHYKNTGLLPQAQGAFGSVDMGMRLPVFDIKVNPQKASPYSKMAQNELALQFYQAGFFSPQMADQALMAMSMMEFEGKDELLRKIAQGGMLFQQMLMMTQAQAGTAPGTASRPPSGGEEAELSAENKESSVTQNARERTAEMTAPV